MYFKKIKNPRETLGLEPDMVLFAVYLEKITFTLDVEETIKTLRNLKSEIKKYPLLFNVKPKNESIRIVFGQDLIGKLVEYRGKLYRL